MSEVVKLNEGGHVVSVAVPPFRLQARNLEGTMENLNFYVKKNYHVLCKRSQCMYGKDCRLKDSKHTFECHQLDDYFPYERITGDTQCVLPPNIISCCL